MSKVQRTFIRYSNCFKEKVVQEVSAGSSISSVCRRYGIKNMSVVSKWIRQFGRNELLNTVIRVKMRSEDDKIKQLEAENRRLKIALADATLAKDVLETLIEVVDEHYQTDVKKNFGHGLSPDVPKQGSKK
jgi:transposase-like protein